MQLKQKIRELCWKIEELPASELQTEISVMASELLSCLERQITLTECELNEIKLCMYYTENLKHGTVGHNRMVLIASLAYANGFAFMEDDLIVPDSVMVGEFPNDQPPNQSL